MDSPRSDRLEAAQPRRTRWVAALLLAAALAFLLAPALGGAIEGEGARFFGLWRLRHVAPALALAWLGSLLWVRTLSRRLAKGIAASTAALACAFAAAEGAGFALGIDWSSVVGGGSGKLSLGHAAVAHLEQSGLAQQDIAPFCDLDFERLPYRFRADQRGFRNEVDRDAADLYLLGDSFIVAGLVPSAELVGTGLEERLRRPAMNVALSGISPQAERDLLLGSGLPLDGRLVLHFVFEGNDLKDSAEYRSRGAGPPEPRSRLDRSLCVALVVHLQRLSERWVARPSCSKGELRGETYLFGWLRPSFEGLEGECDVIGETLLGLKAEVESRGGAYAVVLIPAKIRVLGPFCSWPPDSVLSDFESHLNPLRDYLTQWAREREVALLDLSEPLTASVEAGRVPWFPADTHWNGTGHAVAADAIAGWAPVVDWLARSASVRGH